MKEERLYRENPGRLKRNEIRFEGEARIVTLEARTDSDSEYQQLNYSATGHTDYGYETEWEELSLPRENPYLCG